MIVLDSSAMLAIMRNAPGADLVQVLLDEADSPVFAHAINLAEVFYDVLKGHDATHDATKAEAVRPGCRFLARCGDSHCYATRR